MARTKWKWTSFPTVPDLCPTTVNLFSRYQLPLRNLLMQTVKNKLTYWQMEIHMERQKHAQERQTDRLTEGGINNMTDKETEICRDRQKDRQTYRQGDWSTVAQINRKTDIQISTLTDGSPASVPEWHRGDEAITALPSSAQPPVLSINSTFITV